ncbi:MAG: ABC transporter substrate-binding protein [Solirubrobacterales bacterium]
MPPATDTETTLWYTRCPGPLAFSAAVDLGWLDREFAADDVTVLSLAASSDRAVHQSHFDQTQPNSFRHGGPVPPLVAASRGADIAVIGLSWGLGRQEILALPDSGIGEAADLRGRRLSLPIRVNDSIDFWRALVLRTYQTLLEGAGLGFDDVELVEVPIERAFVDDARAGRDRVATLWDGAFMVGHQREEAVALVRGEVDAIFSWGPIGTVQQAAFGAEVVLEVPLGRRQGVSTFTVSGRLARERPDLVRRVLARTQAVDRDAEQHKDQLRRIVARGAGLPEDLVEATYGADVHEHLGVDLAPEKIEALRRQAAFLHAQGFLERPVDVDALVVRL